MANPDKTDQRTISPLLVSLPIGVLFLLISIAMFQFKDQIPFFNLFLWLCIPLFAFLVVFSVNLSTQYGECGTINSGLAALGAIPSTVTALVALFISSFAVCRIPIASVFTPLFIGNTVDIIKNKMNSGTNSLKYTNSKECCTKKMNILSVESRYPVIEGISYGFYLMFALIYGITIGNGFATIC